MANTVSFSNYEAEDENLKRRQAIYDALRMRALQAPQVVSVGGMGAAPSPLSALANILGAYAAQKGDEQVLAEKNALSGKRAEDLRTGLEAYDKASRDRWEEPGADQAGPPQLIKGDRRKAIFEALASQHPLLQKLGMSQLEAEGKGALTAKDLLPYASRQGIASMVQGGLGGFQPKRDIGEVGGIVYDKDNLQTMELGGPKPTQKVINGDLYELNPSTGQWKKLDNAPKVSTNVHVGGPVIAGQKAGAEAYFKHAAQVVDAAGKAANSSQQLLSTLDTLEQLHKAGINSNITSGLATAAANLAQSLGVKVNAEKLANTEAYNSLITDLWQRSVAQYGGNRGVTKDEAEEIKKLTPLASTSPLAREQLFALQKRGAMRYIEAYKQANKSFAEAATADDPRMFRIPELIEGSYIPQAGNTPNPAVAAPSGKPVLKWGDLK